MAKKPLANQPQRATPQQRTEIQVERTEAFAGPLPHPDTLARYEDIVPGAAERILRWAESETEHRHNQDRRALDANIAAQEAQLRIGRRQTHFVFVSDMFGQMLGFIVSAAAIGGSIFLALNGHTVAACALVSLPLVGIVRALVQRAPAQNGK